jgi:uncharacterized membrane protein
LDTLKHEGSAPEDLFLILHSCKEERSSAIKAFYIKEIKMSDSNVAEQSSVTDSSVSQAAKTNAIIAYCMMVLGLFTGIFWIVGAIWAMVKKSDAESTVYKSHYSNIITTFWWGLLFSIIGALTAVFIVGYVIIFIIWVWSIYRVIKGLALITSDKSY